MIDPDQPQKTRETAASPSARMYQPSSSRYLESSVAAMASAAKPAFMTAAFVAICVSLLTAVSIA